MEITLKKEDIVTALNITLGVVEKRQTLPILANVLFEVDENLFKLTATDLERLKVYFKNLRPEYKEKSKVKLRVVGRELYPTTAFATTPAELDVKYLPSASAFYQVKDADTEEEIIPFGTGSKISCDSTGNFFNIQMDGLQAERNYRFCSELKSILS